MLLAGSLPSAFRFMLTGWFSSNTCERRIKSLIINDGNLQIDLPLGENLQTFAVANADHLTDVDSLSKVVVYQDIYAQKQV